jgi:hypothetical protein
VIGQVYGPVETKVRTVLMWMNERMNIASWFLSPSWLYFYTLQFGYHLIVVDKRKGGGDWY